MRAYLSLKLTPLLRNRSERFLLYDFLGFYIIISHFADSTILKRTVTPLAENWKFVPFPAVRQHSSELVLLAESSRAVFYRVSG